MLPYPDRICYLTSQSVLLHATLLIFHQLYIVYPEIPHLKADLEGDPYTTDVLGEHVRSSAVFGPRVRHRQDLLTIAAPVTFVDCFKQYRWT